MNRHIVDEKYYEKTHKYKTLCGITSPRHITWRNLYVNQPVWVMLPTCEICVLIDFSEDGARSKIFGPVVNTSK